MKFKVKTLLLIAILFYSLAGIACSTHEDYQENRCDVYVLKHEWHTGIIFEIDDIKDSFPLVMSNFSQAKYIEIGWGDKEFYMAEKETFLLAIKAAFWPTKSVLHVAEIKNRDLLKFNDDELIKLTINKTDFDKLVLYIKSSFYQNEKQEVVNLGYGLYGNSYFYLSNEKYHLFKTCNVWLAKGLKKSNIPIKPLLALTSKNVMKQLNKK